MRRPGLPITPRFWRDGVKVDMVPRLFASPATSGLYQHENLVPLRNIASERQVELPSHGMATAHSKES
jgi:hypothetical protein